MGPVKKTTLYIMNQGSWMPMVKGFKCLPLGNLSVIGHIDTFPPQYLSLWPRSIGFWIISYLQKLNNVELFSKQMGVNSKLHPEFMLQRLTSVHIKSRESLFWMLFEYLLAFYNHWGFGKGTVLLCSKD